VWLFIVERIYCMTYHIMLSSVVIINELNRKGCIEKTHYFTEFWANLVSCWDDLKMLKAITNLDSTLFERNSQVMKLFEIHIYWQKCKYQVLYFTCRVRITNIKWVGTNFFLEFQKDLPISSSIQLCTRSNTHRTDTQFLTFSKIVDCSIEMRSFNQLLFVIK
jgi:hypothetical protein